MGRAQGYVTDWDPARAPDWDEALKQEFTEGYWKQLHAFLSAERARYDVFPPRQEIFRACHLTRLADTKVVIIGQDPYPTRGHAHGLCFSVRCGVGVPRSLANIKRVETDPTLSFKAIAEALNRKKKTMAPPGAESWTARLVRKAYVS